MGRGMGGVLRVRAVMAGRWFVREMGAGREEGGVKSAACGVQGNRI